MGELDAHFRLKDRLETVKDRYEFVVIDTPPALGLITVNALVAATHLLIPVQSSYFALEGTDDLLETVEKIRARPNPDLKLLGAVITLHDKRTTLSRDVQKAIAEVFGGRVFETTISKSIRLEESPAHRESIFTSRLNRAAPTSTTGSARRSSNVSSPRRLGLPETLRMRHDTHFVDQLARPGGEAIGRLIPIEDIEPNPNQPRQALGDLSELTASIREKGILEPILVRTVGRPLPDHRGRAPLSRGHRSGPRRDALRRPRDLRRRDDGAGADREPPAQGPDARSKKRTACSVLAETYGYTHEKMAEKLGKSRSSITETLSLTAMPEEVRQLCRLADIQSKSVLLQIVRQGDREKMTALVERLGREGADPRRGSAAGAQGRSATRTRAPEALRLPLQPEGE